MKRSTRGSLAGAVVLAALAISMIGGVGSADAKTYKLFVYLDEQTQTATGIPGDPGGVGGSNVTMDNVANTVCATTYWSGIDSPVVAGHIHGGAYGQPENPAVT